MTLQLFTDFHKTIDYANSQPGDVTTYSPSITVNLGIHIQAELRFTDQTMDVQAGELFNSQLMDARLKYQFSVKSFLRLVVQYNDTERNQSLYNDPVDSKSRNLGMQLLYSYKFNPQTVFFLGYSDSAYEDDTFTKIDKTDKTLFMKMSYYWLQ